MGFASKLTTNFFAKDDAAVDAATPGESPQDANGGGSAAAAARSVAAANLLKASAAFSAAAISLSLIHI